MPIELFYATSLLFVFLYCFVFFSSAIPTSLYALTLFSLVIIILSLDGWKGAMEVKRDARVPWK